MNEQALTTYEDLLDGYKQEVVQLSTGKRFRIQTFMPGNLMIEIGSPIVESLTEASEEDLRQQPLDFPRTEAGRVWSRFEQVVCDNVISIRFSLEPQDVLPEGLVSLSRLTLGEIQELYIKIRDLSISPEELETFRKARGTAEESEQPELDTEDSEDTGEEQG